MPSRPSARRAPAARVLASGLALSAALAVSAVQAVPAAHAADAVQAASERYAPSAVADRVTLIPTTDPAHSQRVSWRSTAETPRAQIIEAPAAFGDVQTNDLEPIDGTDYDAIRTVDATTEEVAAGTAGYTNRYHHVEFTGLKPNTRYAYRVGDGTSPDPTTSGSGAGSITNWSAWEDFTTPSEGFAPYSFVYFGDAQNYIGSAVPRVFHQALLDRPEAKVVLHAGDLINQTGVTDANRAVQEKEWGEWFAAGALTNATRNVIATPGNHEYNSSTAISPFWKPQFPLPENGPKGEDGEALEAVRRSTYFVDYQGVRYISLDSSPLQNGPVQEQVRAAQTAWLEDVLKDPQRPKWTVVTFHHPVYAGTSTRNNSVVRESWNPLFDRYGVDLVLQGHDHVYNRGNQVKDDDPADPTKSHGTVYSISVSGGKMYQLNAGENWTENGAHRRVAAGNIQLYQLVDVERDELTYQARLANGEFFDGYRITKAGDAPDGARTVQDLERDPDAERPDAPAKATETTTTLEASAERIEPGRELVLRAKVAGDGAAGQVRFHDGGEPLGDPVDVRDGVAELHTSTLAEGHHAVTATFVPADADAHAPSGSTAVLVAVARPLTAPPLTGPAPAPTPTPTRKATPRITAHAAGTARRGGRTSVVVAVSADGRVASGRVTVRDRTTKRTWKRNARLRNGLVSVRSPKLTRAGVHRLQVSYGGSDAAAKRTVGARVRVSR
ncbi:metallophosphoesterase [Patulibacter sp. S7RM1-6]